jgi:site-specific DNA recombinase
VSKAVVYLRVSTDEQAESGLGLEAQLAACRMAAQRMGLDVASTHEDDLSGGLPLERRPSLVEAIASLDKGDTLFVAKMDRLSRGDPFTSGMIEAAVNRQGARVASAAGEGTGDDEPSSVLMRRIISAFAEYERLLIKARTRAALKAKRLRGERSGQVPYGHHLAGDGRTLEHDQAELEALALIGELRAAGLSLRAIATELDRREIPTKSGRPWSHSTVQTILERCTHAEGCATD